MPDIVILTFLLTHFYDDCYIVIYVALNVVGLPTYMVSTAADAVDGFKSQAPEAMVNLDSGRRCRDHAHSDQCRDQNCVHSDQRGG